MPNRLQVAPFSLSPSSDDGLSERGTSRSLNAQEFTKTPRNTSLWVKAIFSGIRKWRVYLHMGSRGHQFTHFLLKSFSQAWERKHFLRYIGQNSSTLMLLTRHFWSKKCKNDWVHLFVHQMFPEHEDENITWINEGRTHLEFALSDFSKT